MSLESILHDYNIMRRKYNDLTHEYNDWYFKNEKEVFGKACTCGIISTSTGAALTVINHIENDLIPLIDNNFESVEAEVREPFLESVKGTIIVLESILKTAESQICDLLSEKEE